MSGAYEYGGIEREQPHWTRSITEAPIQPESEGHDSRQTVMSSAGSAFVYGGMDKEKVDWVHA